MKLVHLATEADVDTLLPLVAAFHAEMGFDTDGDHRLRAVAPLLEGSPHGAIWLMGPRRSPVGYVAISFGWSVELGGMDAILDEIYVRPAVRGRGMALDALSAVAKALAQAGVVALHLEADRDAPALQRFYTRAGFQPRDRFVLMTRRL